MTPKAIVVTLLIVAVLWKHHQAATTTTIIIIPREGDGIHSQTADVVKSNSYRYDAAPSVSKAFYVHLFCDAGPACIDAPLMYDILVAAGIDPVVEAAQAKHETSLGTDGIGRSNYKNLHGVQCHSSDGRIADSKVSWGNGCAGIYATYADSVKTWANVINKEYVALGLNTPALAVSKYAPVSDGNDPPGYIMDMEHSIDEWRSQDGAYGVPSNFSMASNPIAAGSDAFGINIRAALNANNGALRHVTINPGATWSFNASVGNPNLLVLATIVHAGDGWCNLAARYAQVGRQAGLLPRFQDHEVGDLGGGPENSVAIWNVEGLPGTIDGRQDLELTNPTNQRIVLDAIENNDTVTIVAARM